MDERRFNGSSIYKPNTQEGGSSYKNKVTSYSPKDDSRTNETDIKKLFKVNRLLQKELDETKAELAKVKAELGRT
jgi:hypothetical protein